MSVKNRLSLIAQLFFVFLCLVGVGYHTFINSNGTPNGNLTLRNSDRGMALLSWFPRVKLKLLSYYDEQLLARTSIRAMERILEESKENDRLSPRDFLEFKGDYTDARVDDAVQSLYARLSGSRLDSVVKGAIGRQIENAQQSAYAYMDALENPQGEGYSFYVGGF